MKTISLLITLALSFSLGPVVLAQETELPNPGLTPDSLFYVLEWISEGIGTFFTFGDLKKAERYAALAVERLAEVQAMVEKGKHKFVEKTLQRYENQLNNSIARAEKAQAKTQNTEKVMEVVARVGKATSVHLEVLAQVYEKVPEQAKPAIERAMTTSVKGHEKAVEALKAQNALGEVPEAVSLPEEIPEEARERIQIKAQEELIVEKALQGSESSRDLCTKTGGPPEICEKIPLRGFKSFEALKAFYIEIGGPPETWALIESKCKELGATTPDECFRLLLVSTSTAYSSAELKAVPAPSLSEEEMEERRRIEEEIRREEETRGREEENTTIKYQTPEGTIEMSMEELECEFNEIIFYYQEGCSFCQRVKDDGTIERIEELEVKVNQVDVAIGPIQHQFSGVPTFVIDKKVYIGYKTFEQIKDLLGCQ